MNYIYRLLLTLCLVSPVVGCSSSESEPAAPTSQGENTETAAPAEGSETTTDGAGDNAEQPDATETTE